MNDIIPNVKLALNIRPIQYVYFYRNGNKNDLIRILKFLNTQWGGIYNIIVPIFARGGTYPFLKQILEIHPPDQFVSTLDKENNIKLRQFLTKLFPKRKIEIADFKTFEEFDNSAHPLGFISKKGSRNTLLCPKVSNIKNRELIQLALFGEIYPTQIDDYKEIMSIQDFNNLDTSDQIISSQFWIEPYYSPINFTAINIKTYTVSNGFFTSADMIDLVIGDDENSICYYWNLRALREKAQFNKTNNFGRRVLLLPLKILNDDSSLEKFFNEIREILPSNRRNCNLNICIDSIPKNQIPLFDKKISSLEFVKKFEDKQVKIKIGKTGFEESKLTYCLLYPQWVGYEAQVGTSSKNYFIQDLSINHNQITYIPPKGYTNSYFQSVSIDIISDIWKSYPKSNLASEKIRNASYFSKYGLTSFSLASKSSNNFEFNLLDDWTKLKLFFEEKGYEIKPSKITNYSNAVVNQLGGIKNLNVLNNKLVINLLDILAVKSSKKLSQKILAKTGTRSLNESALLKIFDEFNLAPELKSIPKTYEELKSLSQLSLFKSKILTSLNLLSEKQLVKRGFYIECESCGIKEWYSLADADEFLVCQGCGNKFMLPVEGFDGIETKWRYRLNSLMNRAVDQDIITALAAVGYLVKTRTTFCNYFGIDLYKLNGTDRLTDIDFCFVENQKIHVGECKTNDMFSKKDFNNTKLMANLGIDEFYFCTLSELGEETLSKIDSLKATFKKKNVKMNISTLSSTELLK